MFRFAIVTLLSLFPLSVFAQASAAPTTAGAAVNVAAGVNAGANTAPAVDAAIGAMQKWYVEKTGLYRTTGWWNSANAFTALMDYSRLSGTKQYLPVIANTFVQAQIVIPKPAQVDEQTGAVGFLNQFYDDEGWWALAWIDAYDLTKDARYLAMAQSIFADMAASWDSTCGGGIWWSKERKYKNAIANELFLAVAVELAARDSAHATPAVTNAAQPDYADWAAKEWGWFKNSGMINGQGVVNDGLAIDAKTGVCTNNQGKVFTYNQGVLLGALAEWSATAHDAALLPAAQSLATTSLAHLTDPAGVLHDPCEPKCGGDGTQFKGIFVRNLVKLNAVAPDARYTAFFKVNAESILTHDQGPGNQFGEVWSGPYTAADAATQSSAINALMAR